MVLFGGDNTAFKEDLHVTGWSQFQSIEGDERKGESLRGKDCILNTECYNRYVESNKLVSFLV